jgi:tRNA threonylcarbamoyladenosine biosynthesis protein TsaB
LAALAGTAGATSVAVLHEGRLHQRSQSGVAQHARFLLPLLDGLLGELDLPRTALEAVAYGRGPGPFTGGRIVVATAQGLGLGLGVPLVPVSSLAATAWASERNRAAVALEAGQGEVYWGLYERTRQGVQIQGEEIAVAAGSVPLPETGADWWGVGNGWERRGEALGTRLAGCLAGTDPAVEGGAEAVAALALGPWQAGETLTPAQAVPTYLRASYAER